MSITFADALARTNTAVPAHLEAQAEVPVLSAPQRQGDLMVIPITDAGGAELVEVPESGVQVVVGEATGNTHWLHRGFDSPGVRWARVDSGLRLAVVEVPDGESAVLSHTDEHGANGIGPGLHAIHGKRELADVVRRVAD